MAFKLTAKRKFKKRRKSKAQREKEQQIFNQFMKEQGNKNGE